MRNNAQRRRSNLIEGRNSYMYMNSSAAPVLPQEEYTYRPKKRPRPRPEPETVSYTRVRESRGVLIMPVVLLCALTVVLSVALLSIHAKKAELKAEIRSVQALTQKIGNSTESMEMMVNETVDMEEVKDVAAKKLGMQPAAPHQIIKINVAKDSYSVQYDDNVANAHKKTLLEKIGIKNSGN